MDPEMIDAALGSAEALLPRLRDDLAGAGEVAAPLPDGLLWTKTVQGGERLEVALRFRAAGGVGALRLEAAAATASRPALDTLWVALAEWNAQAEPGVVAVVDPDPAGGGRLLVATGLAPRRDGGPPFPLATLAERAARLARARRGLRERVGRFPGVQ